MTDTESKPLPASRPGSATMPGPTPLPASSLSSPSLPALPGQEPPLPPELEGRPRFGIGPQLFLVLVAVALLPLLAIGLYAIRTSVDGMQGAIKELQLAAVSDLSHTAQRELRLSRLEVETIGQVLLGPGDASDDVRLQEAEARLTRSSALEWLTVYDLAGGRLGTLKVKEAKEPQTPDRLPEAVLTALKTQPTVLGEVLGGGSYPVVQIFARVEVNGVLKAYLLAGASLEPICAVLADIAANRFDNGEDVIYLIDASLHLVAHPDPRRAALRESREGKGVLRAVQGKLSFHTRFGISPEFTDQRGERRLGALETIPELGWALAIEVPLEEAYGPARHLRNGLIIGALLSFLLTLAIAAAVAGRLTRPVRALVAGARKLGARDFGTRVQVDRADELGQLAGAFNHMAASLQDSEEKLQREGRIRSDLSRYLSPDVVEEIIHHPERMRLGGEKRTVTVMFADIVGFTGLSERLEPEVICAVLNELFTIATEIVLRRGGIIDKFIGDCVMAVFGAPQSAEDDAARAVRAAEDLQRWLEVGNRRWRKAYNIELAMAIGINTGPVVAGNIGSQKRMEYTVIGDTVNIAARLESLARPGQIIISQATREAIGEEFEVEPTGTQSLAGRTATTTIFAIKAV